MTDEELDAAIIKLFPDWPWGDDVPMPSTDFNDGMPLILAEGVDFSRNTAPGGWDGEGSTWWAFCIPDREGAYSDSLLRAGMLALLKRYGVTK